MNQFLLSLVASAHQIILLQQGNEEWYNCSIPKYERRGHLKLTREDVAKIALLARLELSDQEIDSLGGHINRLLENFEKLTELDTENVEPTSHTVPVHNVLRADVSRPSLTQEEVLANAPERVDGTFEVPRIVET